MEDALKKELSRRLLAYDKLFVFVNDLANLDATTDSWYSLFKVYQKEAANLIKDITVK